MRLENTLSAIGRWKSRPPCCGRALRTERYKLNIFAGEDYYELFDLEQDPDELHNRMGDPAYGEIEAALRRALLFRMMEDEDPLPERKSPW